MLLAIDMAAPNMGPTPGMKEAPTEGRMVNSALFLFLLIAKLMIPMIPLMVPEMRAWVTVSVVWRMVVSVRLQAMLLERVEVADVVVLFIKSTFFW